MDKDAVTETSANSNTQLNGISRLTDWGVIHAEGPDAAKFLHGQLTQDVEHLSPSAARLAGYCTAKGRLLATFVMWQENPQSIFLACSADLLPATLKRLQMYVMRAKCKLQDASEQRPLWGLAGPLSAALPLTQSLSVWGRGETADAGTVVRLPDALVNGQTITRHLLTALPAAQVPTLPEETWRWLEVHSAVVRVVAATLEQFVPQMVNLELVGGVNFQKGCFPGQEVVARSQYRGTTKRRAFIVHSSSGPLLAGQEVFSSADPEQPAGQIALAAVGPDGSFAALAELKLAALQDGSLHAASVGGPQLKLGALPYPIAADETAN